MAEQQMTNVVASSSNSSSMLSLEKYDVFLSFRGEDTRRNFTSPLYEALLQKKIETYIDYQLEKGDEITPALIKAIEDSCISIVWWSAGKRGGSGRRRGENEIERKRRHLVEIFMCESKLKKLWDGVQNIGHLVSLRELDLRGTSIESLPENIQNLSMLKTLWLDDCRKLVSLPKLPPYLEQLRAFNCTLLEIDTTQWLGPVLNACVSCSIYQGGKHVGWNGKSIVHCANLIPDHVLFLYHDVCKVYRESIVHSSSDIPFNFEFDYYDVKVGRDQEKIKGCGVFPRTCNDTQYLQNFILKEIRNRREEERLSFESALPFTLVVTTRRRLPLVTVDQTLSLVDNEGSVEETKRSCRSQQRRLVGWFACWR
ncbi:hypothetical protein JHK82_039736 [Glycine max]|nr:hypothetical protein JHK82_039736 [Glycine max]